MSSTWKTDWKYALWLPLYLFCFYLLEQRTLSNYWATQLPLDDLIPFCVWFAIPYYLWFPLLFGVGFYLLLRDSAAFRRYMRFLALTFFSSALIWYLIPNGQDLRPLVLPQENLLTHLMHNIYRVDTHTNVFPSVHVVGSVGAALAVRDCALLRRHRWLPPAICILAACICLSTVFVKQHSILDLLGGLVLAFVVAIPVYFRPKT